MRYFQTRPRYWLTRLYCSLSVVTSAINTFAEPRSLTAQAVVDAASVEVNELVALRNPAPVEADEGEANE